MKRRAGLRSRRAAVFAVVAGGGTAGHVTPALAIGHALVDRGHPPETIRFVGSRRGIERDLVPAAGFSVTLLPGRGIARRATWANVPAAGGLALAVLRALWIIGRLRPAVVVVVGGYASVACAVAAAVLRVPIVVTEQNATPGLANRFAARFAAASAAAFAETALPRTVVTGNPVRPEILAVDRSEAGRRAAREALGLSAGRKVVFVAGGSLGARRINDAVAGLVEAWRERGDVAIRHVVGTRGANETRDPVPPLPEGGLLYHRLPFDHRMDLTLAATDVAVQRAGGNTVAELTVAGVPSILVPLPGAPGDHQTFNARRLAEAGAAVLVPDPELDARRLGEELERLLADSGALASMSCAARSLGRPGAASAVASIVEEHARG